MQCYESIYDGFSFAAPRRKTIPRPSGNIPVHTLRDSRRRTLSSDSGEQTTSVAVAATATPSLDGYSAAFVWLLIGWLVPSIFWYWLPVTVLAVLCTNLKYWLPGAFILAFVKFYFL